MFKRHLLVFPAFLLTGGLALAFAAHRQTQTQQTQTVCPPGQTCAAPPAQTAPPVSGAPGSATGPVIVPKAPVAPPQGAPPPPPPPAQQQPQYRYQVTVPDVQIPVKVETSDGTFVPRLTADQFRLSEDGVPQKINKLELTADAPMTATLLIEFRADHRPLMYEILMASLNFTQQLQPQDWVALMTFDIKTHLVVDFTHEKGDIQQALASQGYADFSDADTFDAVSDALDRLEGVSGHKLLLLIGTGSNTFSRLNWDQMIKKIKAAQGVTIDAISMRESVYGPPMIGSPGELASIQADNELRTMAELTGGMFYEPRFEGEWPNIFQQVAAEERNQYILDYTPTNRKLDGSFRKVRVDLVGSDGKPLKMIDAKKKAVKYDVIYRNGYTSKHIVE